MPVDPRDVGDVFRRLEPAFDFQRGDAGADQVRQHFQPGQILRAEQIFPVAERDRLAVGNQIVRHPAGLRAFAAIGRAAAQRFAGQALAGVGDAQRAVDEDFQGQVGRVRGRVAELTAQACSRGTWIFSISLSEHSRASTTRLQPSSRANSTPAALVMVICVEAWIGKSGESCADQPADAHVLHDRRVHAGGDHRAQIFFGVGQFVFEDERVEA